MLLIYFYNHIALDQKVTTNIEHSVIANLIVFTFTAYKHSLTITEVFTYHRKSNSCISFGKYAQ